ncbi:hypothetical protein [Aureimonas glaciei]|uniref:Uncharacterized protein n=1 Tax=Aureimonas glaciei TaxID=1776957 RepID=A0A917DG68_9HYPH|nr:hypothetical protein [Aureimonas glaciei]GGD34569.1 hypothetical protein GCM10011335_42040 [Aureimonas glaciei]
MTVADKFSIVEAPRRFGLIDGRAHGRPSELLALVGCENVHPSELVKNVPLSLSARGEEISRRERSLVSPE